MIGMVFSLFVVFCFNFNVLFEILFEEILLISKCKIIFVVFVIVVFFFVFGSWLELFICLVLEFS